MDLHIKVIVYNEPYISNFINYSFPSLLSPNNLPAITKIATVECHIYTHTQEETNKISSELNKYNDLCPIKVQIAPVEEHWYHPPHVNVTPQNIFNRYFTTTNPENTPILFSNADFIWADGSLMYIVKSLMAGNVAIFPPIIKVTSETIFPELNTIKKDGIINLSSLLTRQLLFKHFFPVHAAYNHKSLHFPQHIDFLLIPVETEGILVYYPLDCFFAFVPRTFKVINNALVNEDFFTYKMDIVRNASFCMIISFGSLSQYEDYLPNGTPFDTRRLSHFMKSSFWGNPHSFNIEFFKRPIRIPIVEKINEEIWNKVEKEIEGTIIKEVLEYNGPNPDCTSIPKSLKELQIEALEWLIPIINKRFPQVVLEYLRNS